MVLALLAFLGGVLTILSPCVLPVLPFVFARSEQPFARSTLPLLLGMAGTFAGIATLAAVGGAWAVRLNTAGRFIALFVLAVLGVTLLSRRAADYFARPFVALRQSPDAGRGPQRGAFDRAIRAARRRARLPVGALRGTDPRPHPHGRRDQRSEHGDDDIALCLRTRRHGVPCGRGAARRTRIRRIAEFARRRRMDPARPRRRRAARGRRHRARLGHGHPDPPVIRQHESHRAGAARPAARRRRGGE